MGGGCAFKNLENVETAIPMYRKGPIYEPYRTVSIFKVYLSERTLWGIGKQNNNGSQVISAKKIGSFAQ
jgi:hypothetical protein